MIKKQLLIVGLLFISLLTTGAAKNYVGLFELNSEKNSSVHNNVGLLYVEEKSYAAAIQEFKIAISLNPKSQASAVYYNNLGETYMKVGMFKDALYAFNSAITYNPLYFKYYQNRVSCYARLGVLDSELKKLYENPNPKTFDAVTIGLIYIAKGDINKGVIKLDEFVMTEPNLIISEGIKMYLQDLIK